MALLLPKILESEGRSFYRIDRRWQPKDLIPVQYSRKLLDDVEARYKRLVGAQGEFRPLKRAHEYLRILKSMDLVIRRAKFAWRHDDLVFIQAISEFYSDYGTVLQMLKVDQARGRLEEPEDQE